MATRMRLVSPHTSGGVATRSVGVGLEALRWSPRARFSDARREFVHLGVPASFFYAGAGCGRDRVLGARAVGWAHAMTS